MQHDYLRIDLFLQSSLAITLGIFAQGTPFQNETSKKRWLSRREPPGSESPPVTRGVVTDTFQSFRACVQLEVDKSKTRHQWWKHDQIISNSCCTTSRNIHKLIWEDVWALNYSSAGIFVWKNAPLKFHVQIPDMSPCFKPETHFPRPMSFFLFSEIDGFVSKQWRV